MSKLRFKVVEEAFDRKAIPVEIPAERPEQYYFYNQAIGHLYPNRTIL